ncbi:hypothetical protein SL103_18350 [Streptomyces lydicus]|uniref:Uncharacterized protein n=1 Tax=Streptomyces lydicus TaxID=47763 RepID=A0A1D7VMG5_9ACTN|nr:hypothetical protein SL103_18350 [Streptomyces lydicus]
MRSSRAARREHDDRERAVFAAAAADLQPVHAGQHQVQHHQVGRLGGGAGRGGGTVGSHIDGEAPRSR